VTLRVLLADGDAAFCAAVAQVLAAAPDVALVATAADADEAVRRYRELTPDVVVLGDGIAAMERILAADPDARILAVGGDGSVPAGAYGVLAKDASRLLGLMLQLIVALARR
jgi:DNA-binding NarL/FixJ family response regulator